MKSGIIFGLLLSLIAPLCAMDEKPTHKKVESDALFSEDAIFSELESIYTEGKTENFLGEMMRFNIENIRNAVMAVALFGIKKKTVDISGMSELQAKLVQSAASVSPEDFRNCMIKICDDAIETIKNHPNKQLVFETAEKISKRFFEKHPLENEQWHKQALLLNTKKQLEKALKTVNEELKKIDDQNNENE